MKIRIDTAEPELSPFVLHSLPTMQPSNFLFEVRLILWPVVESTNWKWSNFRQSLACSAHWCLETVRKHGSHEQHVQDWLQKGQKRCQHFIYTARVLLPSTTPRKYCCGTSCSDFEPFEIAELCLVQRRHLNKMSQDYLHVWLKLRWNTFTSVLHFPSFKHTMWLLI